MDIDKLISTPNKKNPEKQSSQINTAFSQNWMYQMIPVNKEWVMLTLKSTQPHLWYAGVIRRVLAVQCIQYDYAVLV